MRPTPEFATFWPPLRAPEAACKMQETSRAPSVRAQVAAAASGSAGSITLGRTLPRRWIEDGLEEDGAGCKEAAGRAVAVPDPTGSFEHDAMPLLQLQLHRTPTVMLTKIKWKWHSEPAKYEGSSEGKGLGKSEHGCRYDDSSMGGDGGTHPRAPSATAAINEELGGSERDGDDGGGGDALGDDHGGGGMLAG